MKQNYVNWYNNVRIHSKLVI
ncbi:IS3 family transposase [Acetobacterium sp. KB-1]